MKVYLHLADGFEEVEALTVVDVLRRANIDIETISITETYEVTGTHGVKVVADQLLDEVDYDQCDMIVLPGGLPGADYLEKDERLIEKIKIFNDQDKWIAAICAAPKILGRLGLLSGKTATCYPGIEDLLKGAKISSDPVAQSGNIITSKGPATAMLFALKIVEVLLGKDTAQKIKEDLLVE